MPLLVCSLVLRVLWLLEEGKFEKQLAKYQVDGQRKDEPFYTMLGGQGDQRKDNKVEIESKC